MANVSKTWIKKPPREEGLRKRSESVQVDNDGGQRLGGRGTFGTLSIVWVGVMNGTI